MKLILKFKTQPVFINIEKSDKVKMLQEFLKAFGYNIGIHNVDSIFGNDTLNALRQFNVEGGLKNKNITKEDFLKYIDEFDLRLEFFNIPSLVLFDKNEQIKDIQEVLTLLGYDIGKFGIDRIYGNDTKTALNKFIFEGKILNYSLQFDKLKNYLLDNVTVTSVKSNFTNELLKLANNEWNYFGNQEIIGSKKNVDGSYILTAEGNTIPIFSKKGHTEDEDPYYLRVGVYWKKGLGQNNYNGRTTPNQPWSAAFISYLLKESGAGNKFLYNESHSVYIRKAILSKINNDTNYGFWGYRLKDYAPQIGDLICYVRGNSKHINYDSDSNNYESHSDIVIAKENNILKVIGGNVENSVSIKHIIIDDDGYLIDKQKKWFVILKNRIIENIPVAINKTEFKLSKEWLDKIIDIIGRFESSNKYGAITGDFDRQGISCGVFQWNIGSGSLQPLLKKSNKNLMIQYLGNELGNELWNVANSDITNGLTIVRTWNDSNKTIKPNIKSKLKSFLESGEMVTIQNQATDNMANDVVSKYFNKWNSLNGFTEINLKDFVWFFDLKTLNGGLNGHLGNVKLEDVFEFKKNKNENEIFLFISNWVYSIPKKQNDENGNFVKTYGLDDSLKNIEYWKDKLNEQNINLFVLSYLRSKLSKPIFQLDVFNRKGTIAIGSGYVHGQKFTFDI